MFRQAIWDKSSLRKAFENRGENSELGKAFDWGMSPQKFRYWDGLANSREPLPQEALDYMGWLLKGEIVDTGEPE